MARWAISDIHGCYTTFIKLLEEINFQKTDTLYVLGDYIDRGKDSKKVLDWMMDKQAEDGYDVHCLMGNHEVMMLCAWEDETLQKSWLRNGGQEALQSFGVSSPSAIPKKYIDFICNLEKYIVLEDYLLVHAGFEFRNAETLEDLFYDEDAMLWIRYWYGSMKPELLGGRRIIHGHTPMPKNDIEQCLNTSLPLDIDGGCVYTHLQNLGYLCAYNMDEKKLAFKANVG